MRLYAELQLTALPTIYRNLSQLLAGVYNLDAARERCQSSCSVCTANVPFSAAYLFLGRHSEI